MLADKLNYGDTIGVNAKIENSKVILDDEFLK